MGDRYRRRVRSIAWTALVCCFAGAVGACSSSSDEGSTTKARVCALVAEMTSTAHAIEDAPVDDPDAFAETLDTAVARYADTARELRPLVPDHLRATVDRLAAAVEQYRFEDAAAQRETLDEDEATDCSAPNSTGTTGD
jgi:hypothetical protein